MTVEATSKPVLSIDIGPSLTRAALMAKVGDRYRLVTDLIESSSGDISSRDVDAEIRAVLESAQQLTGWRLIEDGGRPVTDGTVEAVVTPDFAPPLPVMCLAFTQQGLDQMVFRALTLGFVDIVFAGSVERDSDESGFEHLLHAIDGMEVSALFLSAKSKREASVLAGLLRAVRLSSHRQEGILGLFAGSKDAAEAFSSELPTSIRFRYAGIGEWGAASFDPLIASALLTEAYAASAESLASKMSERFELSRLKSTQPSAIAQSAAAAILSEAIGGSVGIVDVGEATTTCVVVGTEGSYSDAVPSERGHPPESSVALGPGSGMGRVIKRVPLDPIQAWLPFDISSGDFADYLANLSLRGSEAPLGVRELIVHMAVARECGAAAVKGSRSTRPDVLVASGVIGSYPRLGQVVLTLLDIFQPTRPCRLLADRSSLLPRLAALGQQFPDVALEALEDAALVNLGPCLSITGSGTEGETVAEITLESTAQVEGDQNQASYDIRYGSVTVIPLRPDQRASLRVVPARKFSFNLDKDRRLWAGIGPQEVPEDERTVAGGVVGLIVDARGRPLELSPHDAVRQARLIEWLQALDAFDAEVFSRLD